MVRCRVRGVGCARLHKPAVFLYACRAQAGETANALRSPLLLFRDAETERCFQAYVLQTLTWRRWCARLRNAPALFPTRPAFAG